MTRSGTSLAIRVIGLVGGVNDAMRRWRLTWMKESKAAGQGRLAKDGTSTSKSEAASLPACSRGEWTTTIPAPTSAAPSRPVPHDGRTGRQADYL